MDKGETACVQVRGERDHDLARAARLSAILGLPLLRDSSESGNGTSLLVSGGRLGLKAPETGEPNESGAVYFPDWTRIDTASPAGRRSRQPLLRAVQGRRGGKGLMVWDVTAGWGEDAWILAALGHRVLAVERDPLVYFCLLDAWSRAALEAPVAAGRIRPVRADAEAMLQRLAADPGSGDFLPWPDVVYLDPLFPVYKGKKGREKKPMRILRLRAGNAVDDAEDLLRKALMVSRLRVVLKRPRRAETLAPAGRGPVHTVAGRGYRYDIYIPPRDTA
ncbi:MAG: class I SAM-dependent methyltransferase [Desulfohalobiaceae bacterium]|nr:class I SAM-dependent methyltransferase [Desulfohalobiaceae bacterium]